MKYCISTLLLIISALYIGAENSDSCKVILPANSITENDFLLTVPQHGVFVIRDGQRMTSLEEKLSDITFSDPLDVTCAVSTPKGLYIKHQEGIYFCNDSTILVTAFDTDDFQMFPAEDNMIISSMEESVALLFTYDFSRQSIMLLARFSEDIIYACEVNNEYIVVTDSHIYRLTKEGDLYILLEYFEPITSAIMSDYGLFFGTEHNILFLIDSDTFAIIDEQGCRQLLYDNNSLYVLSTNGSLRKLQL